MSGSPVYIDDKMIGAVALGYTNSREAIAGITPIEEMLAALDKTSPAGSVSPVSEASDTGMETEWCPPQPFEIDLAAHRDVSRRLDTGDTSIHLEQLKTPLFISSCSPRLLPEVEDFFSRYGFIPVVSGSGAHTASEKIDLQPGSPVGALLMGGDLNYAAIGTLTYRDGDRIIGFGHSFMGMGNVEVPMVSAVIHTVLKNYFMSFKLGSPVDIIGTVRQDRRSAIGGILGKAPEMIPLKVEVNLPEANFSKEFNYTIWPHRRFAPRLAWIATEESISIDVPQIREITATADYSILLKGHEPIRKRAFFTSQVGINFEVGTILRDDLEALMDNSFGTVGIESLSVRVDMEQAFKVFEIFAARTNRDVYRPGERVILDVYFKPWQKQSRRQSFVLPLPDTIRDGIYTILITNGTTRELLTTALNPGLLLPETLEEFVRLLRINYPRNNVHILLGKGESGVALKGETMSGLPPSVTSAIVNTVPDTVALPVTGKVIIEQTFSMDSVIIGEQAVPIKVDSAGKR